MRFILAWLIQPATALEHTVWYVSISSDRYVPGSCSVLIILLTALLQQRRILACFRLTF